MLTKFWRYIKSEFQHWKDNLPREPFDFTLSAALELAGSSLATAAAAIGVSQDRLEEYQEADLSCLGEDERRKLKAFLASRGVFEVPLIGILGWRGLLRRAVGFVRTPRA